MTRFIIFPVFNGQIREALVQHIENDKYSDRDSYSVHPKIKNSGYFISYDVGKYIFESDRPLWRCKGVKRRPNYYVVKGTFKYESQKEIVTQAIGSWVERNLDL